MGRRGRTGKKGGRSVLAPLLLGTAACLCLGGAAWLLWDRASGGSAPGEAMDRVLSPQEYQEKGEGSQERGRRRREAAQAQATITGEAAAAAFLASFDADGNGSVSKAEFRGPEGSFLRLDLDGDGGISLTEAPQDGIPEVGSMDIYTEWVGLHDTDKDGNVEPGELPGGDNRFEGLDLNKDGELARDELRHLEAHVPESFGLEQDTNQDGQISAREFQGNEATFLNLDVDRDGQISWKRAD